MANALYCFILVLLSFLSQNLASAARFPRRYVSTEQSTGLRDYRVYERSGFDGDRYVEIRGRALSTYGILASTALGSAPCPSATGTGVTPLATSSSSPNPYPNTTSPTNPVSCESGNVYTVKAGDNCQIISENANVSTGTLIQINNLPPSCSNLQIGQSLCLPQTCKTHVIASGETCTSISNNFNVAVSLLKAYNPALDAICANLIAGQNLCISQPGSAQPGTPTIVAPPTTTPSGTTNQCLEYYVPVSGDDCTVLETKFSITLAQLLFWNPSLQANCLNLFANEAYCVRGLKSA